MYLSSEMAKRSMQGSIGQLTSLWTLENCGAGSLGDISELMKEKVFGCLSSLIAFYDKEICG